MNCPKCGSDRVPGTEPAIMFQCGATGTWQPEACHTIAKLRAALKELADAAEPFTGNGMVIPTDYVRLYEERKRALRVLEGQT